MLSMGLCCLAESLQLFTHQGLWGFLPLFACHEIGGFKSDKELLSQQHKYKCVVRFIHMASSYIQITYKWHNTIQAPGCYSNRVIKVLYNSVHQLTRNLCVIYTRYDDIVPNLIATGCKDILKLDSWAEVNPIYFCCSINTSQKAVNKWYNLDISVTLIATNKNHRFTFNNNFILVRIMLDLQPIPGPWDRQNTQGGKRKHQSIADWLI